MKINRFVVDGIPLTTYEVENNEVKPLIYFFHGFTGSRDRTIMGRGEILANLGFYVVAIDAYLHGDREPIEFKKLTNQEKYESIIDIVIHTANDAKNLFHNHFMMYDNIKKDGYYAYGVSMGSATAFYLATIESKLKAISTIVCFPSFVEYYKDKQAKLNFPKDEKYIERMRLYETLDPLIHYERLQHVKIFMGIGEHDDVVDNKYAKALHEKMHKTILKSYNTNHVSTPEMLQDSFDFIHKCKKEKE